MAQSTIFTQIREGKVTGQVIYQDDEVFVMLSIAPHNPGHCLVVPVEEITEFTDLPPKLLHRLCEVAQQMMLVTKAVYGAPRAGLVVAGEEVPHVHLHVFSLFSEADLNPAMARVVSPAELAQEATRLLDYLDEHPIQ